MKNIPIFMLSVMVAYIERSAIAHIIPMILHDGVLSLSQSSLMLAAFGAGYVLTLPFSAQLIFKFGYKVTLVAIMLGWAAAGIAFALSSSYYALLVSRFMLGLFEAPLFPLFVTYISNASSESSRPFRIGVVEMCSYVGMAVAGPCTVFLAIHYGWHYGYGAVALLALLTSIIALIFFDNEPKRAEFIKVSFKWSWPLVFVALGFLSYNFCKTFYSTWMPGVLNKQFGYTSQKIADFSFFQSLAAPLLSIALASISGLMIRCKIPLPIARSIPLGIGFILAATLLWAMIYPTHAALLISLSFIGLIGTSALIWGAIPDMVEKNQVAGAAGYVNAIANIGSILSPLAIGPFLEFAPRFSLLPVGGISLFAFLMMSLAYISWSGRQQHDH